MLDKEGLDVAISVEGAVDGALNSKRLDEGTIVKSGEGGALEFE